MTTLIYNGIDGTTGTCTLETDLADDGNTIPPPLLVFNYDEGEGVMKQHVFQWEHAESLTSTEPPAQQEPQSETESA